MASVEERIVIHAPIDRVFAALTDPARGPEWNPSVRDVSDISSRPIGPGTTWRQVIEAMGRPQRLECRVVQFDPPHEGQVEFSGDQRGRIWTRCSQTSEGTLVIQGMEFVMPGGLFGRMAGGIAVPTLTRELTQTMQRQKQTIERESGGGHGPGTS